jgi:hypothetical protein
LEGVCTIVGCCNSSVGNQHLRNICSGESNFHINRRLKLWDSSENFKETLFKVRCRFSTHFTFYPKFSVPLPCSMHVHLIQIKTYHFKNCLLQMIQHRKQLHAGADIPGCIYGCNVCSLRFVYILNVCIFFSVVWMWILFLTNADITGSEHMSRLLHTFAFLEPWAWKEKKFTGSTQVCSVII